MTANRKHMSVVSRKRNHRNHTNPEYAHPSERCHWSCARRPYAWTRNTAKLKTNRRKIEVRSQCAQRGYMTHVTCNAFTCYISENPKKRSLRSQVKKRKSSVCLFLPCELPNKQRITFSVQRKSQKSLYALPEVAKIINKAHFQGIRASLISIQP